MFVPPFTNYSTTGRRGGGQDELGYCPICKMTLRPIQLESHYLAELEQLNCMSRRVGHRSSSLRLEEPSTSSQQQDSPTTASSTAKGSPTEVSQESRREAYNRARANRYSRLRLKTRRRRREESGGPHDAISCHSSSQNGEMLDEDEPVDIEGDGDLADMDEYEWMAQRRNPALSAVTSNRSSAFTMTTSSRRREEADENDSLEVVVDGDEGPSPYGQAQYTESDIQSSLLLASSSRLSPPHDHHSSSQDTKMASWSEEMSSGVAGEGNGSSENGTNDIVKALKFRVRELEKQLQTGRAHSGNHCHICMDKYRKPVVSVSCWHVHCETCWLRTLGAKKLCPQCNMITSASDLRRIFL